MSLVFIVCRYDSVCIWVYNTKLRGCRHETIEEMKEAMMKVFDTLTQEDFNGTF